MRANGWALLAATLTMATSAAFADTAKTWSKVTRPSPGPAAAIGSAAAGCVAGAVQLPLQGTGWQVLRPQRNRFWGHPATVGFVERLGAAAATEKLGTILIGDMGQPRGGPMSSGHASHQNGLDVDIWFRLPSRPLSPTEVAAPTETAVVTKAGLDRARWTPAHARLVELTARSPEVDRLFVNPPIKADLCRTAGRDRAWLAKVRPWWGHEEHFHVRLACPLGSDECTPQRPVPDGDGCGAELQSWLTKPTLPSPPDKPNYRNPTLPAACGEVLRQGGVMKASAKGR